MTLHMTSSTVAYDPVETIVWSLESKSVTASNFRPQ
jgi:hypothetical protein